MAYLCSCKTGPATMILWAVKEGLACRLGECCGMCRKNREWDWSRRGYTDFSVIPK